MRWKDCASTILCALVQVKGSITFNGVPFDQFVPERTASYVTQFDSVSACLSSVISIVADRLVSLLRQPVWRFYMYDVRFATCQLCYIGTVRLFHLHDDLFTSAQLPVKDSIP